jgi:hypothetical protein
MIGLVEADTNGVEWPEEAVVAGGNEVVVRCCP